MHGGTLRRKMALRLARGRGSGPVRHLKPHPRRPHDRIQRRALSRKGRPGKGVRRGASGDEARFHRHAPLLPDQDRGSGVLHRRRVGQHGQHREVPARDGREPRPHARHAGRPRRRSRPDRSGLGRGRRREQGVSDAHPLESVIAAYGEAWNRRDVEAILALHTEDSVFENHTSGGKAVGKAAIRGILEGVFAAFPDIRFDARRTYVRDGVVTQEWTASGTLAVPFTKGATTVQPTGKKVSWIGVDVIPFDGTLVARKDVYVDSMSFLKALGFKKIEL